MKSLLNIAEEMVRQQHREHEIEKMIQRRYRKYREHAETYNHEDPQQDKSYCKGNPFTEEEL